MHNFFPKDINRDVIWVKQSLTDRSTDSCTLQIGQSITKLEELSEDNIFYNHLQARFYETLLKYVGTQRIYTAIPLYLLSFLSAIFG